MRLFDFREQSRKRFVVAGNDRLTVGLAAIDDDAIRSAMALQRLVEEALCRSEIPMLSKEEFDRIANAVVLQDQTMGRLE